MMFSLMQITRGVVTSFIKKGSTFTYESNQDKKSKNLGKFPKNDPKTNWNPLFGHREIFCLRTKKFNSLPPHKKNEKNNKGL